MSNKDNKKKPGNLSTKRIKANRICRRKKKEWIERKIKVINETNSKNDTRKFYKDVRNLTNSSITTTTMAIYYKKKDKYQKDGNNTLRNY
jgi:hypothetical protein